VHSAGETLNPTAQKHYRRNFAMGVINAAAFQVAETMIDSSLVLTWFLSQLTTSNLLIGLPAPIRARRSRVRASWRSATRRIIRSCRRAG